MRRKSERNKGKSSPEKKPEKPTRKSARRRTKKSPSTTPEREVPPEPESEKPEITEPTYKMQTRLHQKDPESLIEEPESKVSSTDQADDPIDDSGSVWKVARADASPGEIQKLKLCRQRNLSETSDVSLGRKRASKNDGCGGSGGNDSVVEEADSADEKPPTSNEKFNVDNLGLAEDTSSTTIGRDSGEEVSDSKEIPPETTTVDLSDVKQKNIDQEHQEQKPESTADVAEAQGNDEGHGKPEINLKTEETSGVVDDNGAVAEEKGEILEETGKTEAVDAGKNQSSDEDKGGNEGEKKEVGRVRSGRRKHRDKYRDSSNSDSGESEEEIEVKKEAQEVGKEEESVKEEKKEDQKEEKDAEALINICKPAKVNLKRSFTSRISTDESKRDDTESTNDASQDKENHLTEDSKTIPKRRRWGTALTADIAPILSISTDSLKALVPGAKPLSMNEVRLTKDDDDDRDRRREKRYTVNESEKVKEEIEAKNDSSKDNHIAARRKISIVKDTPQLISPSPPVAQPTNILLIKNLVRPFTLNQIKELLSRTGTIVENGFWMDRIKSKCFVEYSNEDQAFETRQALHGISWPMSNPKKLQVEYSTREEMDKMKESSKDQPLSRKLEASSGGDPWQQDWGREEKANAAAKVTVVREWDLGKEDGQHLLKDKDKEKKEMDKKRRQRSRSPTLEEHLPAPARKFKKKEDEPPPAKLLDDLFRKTKATPSIYWLPLTNEQIVVKEEMRRQHMAEHARRLEEMRRAERNRDNRRRRSPRK